MRPPQPRLGTYVTIRGREYQANALPAGGQVTIFSVAEATPDPDLFVQDEETGHWVATVATADCDFVMAVHTRASWKGEQCVVMNITETGDAVLYHLGHNRARSAADGFRPLEPGTYARTVPVAELRGYREYQYDLLFDEWARGARV